MPDAASADYALRPSVESPTGTRIIDVAVSSVDPEAAASCCNSIVDAYAQQATPGVKRDIIERAQVPTARGR